ncbi:MAG TPA: hypothetical protein VG227_00675 [Caulobacteraceae bacterium]|jgi:hypothetical protein|nr:hypothetical protein [Caulobacteraceae bacterium]
MSAEPPRATLGFDLEPMGQIVVEVEQGASWAFEGPFGGRSCTCFREVVWKAPSFEARSLWQNGTYRSGGGVADAEIRAMLKADDETLIYLRYVARFSLTSKPSFTLTGQVEASAKSPQFKWTDLAQIVGVGELDTSTWRLTYDVGVVHPNRLASHQSG